MQEATSYRDCWWELVDLYLTQIHQFGEHPEDKTKDLEDWVKERSSDWGKKKCIDLDFRCYLRKEVDWAAVRFIIAEEKLRSSSYPKIPIAMREIPVAPRVPLLGRVLIWGAGVNDLSNMNWKPLSFSSISQQDIIRVDYSDRRLFTLSPLCLETLKSDFLAGSPFSWEWTVFSLWEEGKDAESDDRLNEARRWMETHLIPLSSFAGKALFSLEQAKKLRPALISLWQYSPSMKDVGNDLKLLSEQDKEIFDLLCKSNEVAQNLSSFQFTAEIARDNSRYVSRLVSPLGHEETPLKWEIDAYLEKLLKELEYLARLGSLVCERLGNYLQKVRAEVMVLRSKIEEKRYKIAQKVSIIAFAVSIAIGGMSLVGLVCPEGCVWRTKGAILSFTSGAVVGVTLLIYASKKKEGTTKKD